MLAGLYAVPCTGLIAGLRRRKGRIRAQTAVRVLSGVLEMGWLQIPVGLPSSRHG